jgi:hypothetical protein
MPSIGADTKDADAKLTTRQKNVLAGGFMLALGCVIGVKIAPDDPQRDDKLAALGSAVGSATPAETQLVDVEEYHRIVTAARAAGDFVDFLSEPVRATAVVAAEVNMPLGARPGDVDLVGLAEGRFVLDCQGCGVTFEDKADTTVFRLRAQNTSRGTVRLTAFVHYTPPPP